MRRRCQSAPSRIVILDFGSQYSRLIARRVREASVYCEIVPFDAGPDVLHLQDVKGIILSGGPNSVYEDGAPLIPSWVFDAGVPVLGICYGMQALAHQLGGAVVAGAEREYGHALLHLNGAIHPLFKGLDTSVPVRMSPRRPNLRNAAGVHLHSILRELAVCRHGQRVDARLRHSVPSGGYAHPARRSDHPQLCAWHLRRVGFLDTSKLRARLDISHSATGWRWQSRLRAVWRKSIPPSRRR